MSNTDSVFQPRREERIPIESVNLPFLATRAESMTLFQYLLLDISLHGARILLPQWVIRRELLYVGEQIDFHLPFLFEEETFNKGNVAWAKWDDDLGGQVCGVRIDVRAPLYYPVYVSFHRKAIAIDLPELQTTENLLKKILKDSILLKKGILIYLKHLKPLLARITDYDASTLQELTRFLFEDVRAQVQKNIALLTDIMNNIGDDVCSMGRLQYVFDLEDLRQAMEPEMDVMVWNAAFVQDSMRQYVDAIFSLERKIFYNYNTLVMLYAQALTRTGPACPEPKMENVSWSMN